jgi:peptidoglycan/xylan/chitin deacetylase (PgdA/CDA1 family)
MKRWISIFTAFVVTLSGTAALHMRQTLRLKEKTPPPPEATTVPYKRPEGVHAAPEGAGKRVALTFDDGPGGKVTNHILDQLAKFGGHATFFCLGDRAETFGKTLGRIVASGNEVGSHSYAHERLTRLRADDLDEDLERAVRQLEAFAGQEPQLLRPPYGSVSERVCDHAGLPIVLWSVDTEDWRYCEELCKNRTDEQRREDYLKVVNSVVDYVQDGDIILMHDLYNFTQDVADVLIAELSHQGWQLVTVSELFAAKGIKPRPGEVYHCAR